MALVTQRHRDGRVVEISPLEAQHNTSALSVLDAKNALSFAVGPTDQAAAQDAHDTAMANLVALHGGDQEAAMATLSGVDYERRMGKK